jgi:hypothetical protein
MQEKTFHHAVVAMFDLSRWVEKFITISLRMEQSEMKQSQGFRDFYILLHSLVYFSQPTYARGLLFTFLSPLPTLAIGLFAKFPFGKKSLL